MRPGRSIDPPGLPGLSRQRWRPPAALLLLLGTTMLGTTGADDSTTVAVTIREHRFIPSEIRVPAGRPVVLDIENEDATAEEFDSHSLKVEKVIAGGKSGTVRIRPLDKGVYPFVGEYHQDTAHGAVIAD